MKETHKISDLEQIRLLSDPLKLKLLQAFAEAPKTTKQVAAELDESVTKLYRHVDALHDSGLLVVVEEKQKRGTVERTFRAVAQRFEADHSLFSGEAAEHWAEAVRETLRVSESEILKVLANATEDGRHPTFMRIRGKASPAKIAELQAMLNDWIESVTAREESSAEETKEFGGLVAFYRID